MIACLLYNTILNPKSVHAERARTSSPYPEVLKKINQIKIIDHNTSSSQATQDISARTPTQVHNDDDDFDDDDYVVNDDNGYDDDHDYFVDNNNDYDDDEDYVDVDDPRHRYWRLAEALDGQMSPSLVIWVFLHWF